jgi:5'-3' exonuclease
MSRLLLIDLSGLFWQNWHATADKELGAAFTLTLKKIQSYAGHYDHVAIALDRPPYKRKQISQEYKAQRDTPAEDALDQFRRIRERLSDDGYLLWGVDGFEADDVIATAARIATTTHGMSVDILSADKDLMQVIDDELKIVCISPRTGERYNSDGVFSKFGVLPDHVGDQLALTGDKSDNVPGIPGVGPKRAAALLDHWGSLDELQRAIADGDDTEEISPPAVRKALLENADQLETSRKLVRLVTDLPINFDELFEERERKTGEHNEVPDEEFDDEPGAKPPQEEPSMQEETTPPREEPAEPKQTTTNDAQQKSSPEASAPQPEERRIVRASTDDWNYALEPSTPRGAWRLANAMCESRAFGIANPETALAIIMKGRSLGLDAVTALTSFHMIEGKPSMSAQLLIGMIKASPKCEYFTLVKSTREIAVWRTKRVGEPEPQELDWTLDDARTAGLLRESRSGKPTQWDKMPRTMLRWRCGVELGRAVYPDVITNLYSVEEMHDVIEARGVEVISA